MSRSDTIRTLVGLLLLLSTFVQTKTVDIFVIDERVIVKPTTGWGYWTFNKTSTCPGIWTSVLDGTQTIRLNFEGVGITVYGYSDPGVGPWGFQIDQEVPEPLEVEANTTCKAIKDRQGLSSGMHQVTVTPLSTNLVVTKFSVTLDDKALSSGSPRALPCYLLSLLAVFSVSPLFVYMT